MALNETQTSCAPPGPLKQYPQPGGALTHAVQMSPILAPGPRLVMIELHVGVPVAALQAFTVAENPPVPVHVDESATHFLSVMHQAQLLFSPRRRLVQALQVPNLPQFAAGQLAAVPAYSAGLSLQVPTVALVSSPVTHRPALAAHQPHAESEAH